MVDALQTCAEKTLRSLTRGKIYGEKPFFDYDDKKRTLSFNSTDQGEPYRPDRLEAVFESEDVQRVHFHDLGPGNTRATRIAPFSNMLYNRVLMELGKKWPRPTTKNYIYRMMGMDIPEPSKTVVAPNVYFDFIHPQLTRIEPYVFIGEEALLSNHYFDGEKFVMGRVTIRGGEEKNWTVVGGRSVILPGAEVGQRALVSINAMVSGKVPNDAKVAPYERYSSR